MSVPPELGGLARRWLKKAANDLKTAEHTLTLPEGECPFDIVCFHAQQCAEKSLKAFLTVQGVNFERIHELGQLLQMCTTAPDLIQELDEVDCLTPYAVEARYPDEGEEEVSITRTQAEEAVAMARKVNGAIRRRLPG